ncbi:MAG: hypothetical protein M1813_005256 [Trichoglossum hirsutum]|nr:MAG: hypothetical protein M1813_005256 [Trichoglossum hirsutum]
MIQGSGQPSEPGYSGRAGVTSIEGSHLLSETSGLPDAGPTISGPLGDEGTGATTNKNPSTKDSLIPRVNPCSTDPADPRPDSPRAPSPITSSMLGACADDIASIASIKSGIAPAVPGMPGTLTGSDASSNISLPDTLSETDSRGEEIGEKAIAGAGPADQRAGDTNLKLLRTTDTTDSGPAHRWLPPVTDELTMGPDAPVTIPCWQNNNS